jgi:hypothetical protein
MIIILGLVMIAAVERLDSQAVPGGSADTPAP